MFGGCFYGNRFYHLSYTCGRCVPIASNSNSKELEINEQIRDCLLYNLTLPTIA